MLAKRIAHTHEDPFHVHNLSGISTIGWPTFEQTLWILAPIYFTTLYGAVTTARAGNIPKHRLWAIAHTIAGYTISLERLAVFICYVIGWALTLLPEETVYRALQIENTLADKASAELDILALSNTVAGLLMITWMTYEWWRAGYFRLQRITSVDGARARK